MGTRIANKIAELIRLRINGGSTVYTGYTDINEVLKAVKAIKDAGQNKIQVTLVQNSFDKFSVIFSESKEYGS